LDRTVFYWCRGYLSDKHYSITMRMHPCLRARTCLLLHGPRNHGTVTLGDFLSAHLCERPIKGFRCARRVHAHYTWADASLWGTHVTNAGVVQLAIANARTHLGVAQTLDIMQDRFTAKRKACLGRWGRCRRRAGSVGHLQRTARHLLA